MDIVAAICVAIVGIFWLRAEAKEVQYKRELLQARLKIELMEVQFAFLEEILKQERDNGRSKRQ